MDGPRFRGGRTHRAPAEGNIEDRKIEIEILDKTLKTKETKQSYYTYGQQLDSIRAELTNKINELHVGEQAKEKEDQISMDEQPLVVERVTKNTSKQQGVKQNMVPRV